MSSGNAFIPDLVSSWSRSRSVLSYSTRLNRRAPLRTTTAGAAEGPDPAPAPAPAPSGPAAPSPMLPTQPATTRATAARAHDRRAKAIASAVQVEPDLTRGTERFDRFAMSPPFRGPARHDACRARFALIQALAPSREGRGSPC